MKTLAHNIRALRISSGMSQTELANALGVQFQTVSKWERQITLPDAAILPDLARKLGVSIDQLFREESFSCDTDMPEEETAFLLKTYSKVYGPDAGPWNLSLQNKYLEYRITEFFETNFTIKPGDTICNIGIGAGEWDRYLSYKLHGGSLTSIDRLEICCHQLKLRLRLEENPNKVNVICADAMALEYTNKFDTITIVGTTGIESGDAVALLRKAASILRPDGSLYYQTLDENEDSSKTILHALSFGLHLCNMMSDTSHGIVAHYYRFDKKETNHCKISIEICESE